MSENAAWFLYMAYVPMMWLCMAALALVGVAGLAVPGVARTMLGVFTKNRPVRLMAILFLLVGAEMFIQAPVTATPLLVKTLGVIVFIDGGVGLLIPTFTVILVEWCMARSDWWLRIVGLLCMWLAFVFFLAAKLPPPAVTPE